MGTYEDEQNRRAPYVGVGVVGAELDRALLGGIPPGLALDQKLRADRLATEKYIADSTIRYPPPDAASPTDYSPGYYSRPTQRLSLDVGLLLKVMLLGGLFILLFVGLFSLLSEQGIDQLSAQHSLSPPERAAYYERLGGSPGNYAGVPAAVLYRQVLSKAPTSWAAMTPNQRRAVAAAWGRYQIKGDGFFRLDQRERLFYRVAFASYLESLDPQGLNQAVVGDRARLELTRMGRPIDKAKAIRILGIAGDYSTVALARESLANQLLRLSLNW